MSSKAVWRAEMLSRRAQIGPQKASELNVELSKNLQSFWSAAAYPEGSTWAAYRSFKWEANPSDAIAETQKRFRWIYPKVEGSNLCFFEPAESNAQWIKSSYDIWEPDPLTSTEVSIHDCVGVLIPGVVFDRKGHRVGYGKGFYDRTLAGFRGVKVGVGFSQQLIEENLPAEPHDVQMDFIVTDKEILKVHKTK